MQKTLKELKKILTEHDWLQIEQAARGCISGTGDEWPHLMHAVQLLAGPQPRRSADWLQGFCTAAWQLVGLETMYRAQLARSGFTSWKKANQRRLELIHISNRTPAEETQYQDLQRLAEYWLELMTPQCLSHSDVAVQSEKNQ